jgi:hypothetical protein
MDFRISTLQSQMSAESGSVTDDPVPDGYYLEIDDTAMPQSLALIEYLDDTRPTLPLRPSNPRDRAHGNSLAQLIASDIHPIDNLRVLKCFHAPAWRRRKVKARAITMRPMTPGTAGTDSAQKPRSTMACCGCAGS